jgi:hypothetical protein
MPATRPGRSSSPRGRNNRSVTIQAPDLDSEATEALQGTVAADDVIDITSDVLLTEETEMTKTKSYPHRSDCEDHLVMRVSRGFNHGLLHVAARMEGARACYYHWC